MISVSMADEASGFLVVCAIVAGWQGSVLAYFIGFVRLSKSLFENLIDSISAFCMDRV